MYLLGRHSRWIAALIAALGFVKFALGIMYSAVGIGKHVVFSDTRTLEVYSVGGLSADIACDVVITGAMCFLLDHKRTAYERTNRIITTLKIYVLQSCLLTTVCATASLALWIALPHTLAYAPFYFLLIRLYLLSFLSILNSRDHLRTTIERQDAVAFSNLELSSSGIASGPGLKSSGVNFTGCSCNIHSSGGHEKRLSVKDIVTATQSGNREDKGEPLRPASLCIDIPARRSHSIVEFRAPSGDDGEGTKEVYTAGDKRLA